MVPLLNRPFLAYQLALLRQHGITDVILSCSYRVDDVRAAMGDETFGVRLRYVVEEEPLGTGGGVRNAADLAQGHIFVLNGDVLTDADLTAMRRAHESRGARISIFLHPVDDPRQYGLVETETDGRIRRFREKPGPDEALTTDTINAGIYIIDAELLWRMPADRPVSIEREFFPVMIDGGIPCFGWCPPAYWRDIGSLTAYREAQMDLLDDCVKTRLTPAGELRAGAWVGPGLSLDRSARLSPPAVVGEHVQVAGDAQIGPRTVIGSGCRIGAGARLEGAVLWEGVEIGAGAVLRDCVIGAEARIGARTALGAGVTLPSGAVIAEGTRLPG